jgi:hypothetical protein
VTPPTCVNNVYTPASAPVCSGGQCLNTLAPTLCSNGCTLNGCN